MAIDLVNVAAGAGGFVIHGQDASDASGWSVSSAGDVNGDGFDDLLIGAKSGDGPLNTRPFAGDSYVVFGDGFDDLIIGAMRGGGPNNTREQAGDSYLAFGKASVAIEPSIDLAAVA